MKLQECTLDLADIIETADLKLTLPHVPRRNSIDKEQLRPLAESQAVFYLSEPGTCNAKATKRAAADVAAIRTAFPVVEDGNLILAMASWLSLLCSMDDEVEKLDVSTAQLVLVESISILEGSLRDGRRSPVGYGGACLDSSCDRTRSLTKMFIRQVRGLLPRPVYASVVREIVDVWETMGLEAQYRLEPVPSVDAYLRVRTTTVGLRPFFVLLQSDVCSHEMCDTEHFTLRRLEAEVGLAVGLQNDLVGLRKDLAEGETFNFATIVADTPGFDLAAGVCKAVAMHNEAVRSAETILRNLEVEWASDAVLDYADALLGFIGRHFVWASSAKRYRSS